MRTEASLDMAVFSSATEISATTQAESSLDVLGNIALHCNSWTEALFFYLRSTKPRSARNGPPIRWTLICTFKISPKTESRSFVTFFSIAYNKTGSSVSRIRTWNQLKIGSFSLSPVPAAEDGKTSGMPPHFQTKIGFSNLQLFTPIPRTLYTDSRNPNSRSKLISSVDRATLALGKP